MNDKRNVILIKTTDLACALLTCGASFASPPKKLKSTVSGKECVCFFFKETLSNGEFTQKYIDKWYQNTDVDHPMVYLRRGFEWKKVCMEKIHQLAPLKVTEVNGSIVVTSENATIETKKALTDLL